MNINFNFNPEPGLLKVVFNNFDCHGQEVVDDTFLQASIESDRFDMEWRFVILEDDGKPLFVIPFPSDHTYFDQNENWMKHANSSSSDEVKACNILLNMCDWFNTFHPSFVGSAYHQDMCRLLLHFGGLSRFIDAVQVICHRYIDFKYGFIGNCEILLDDEDDW